MLAGARVGGCWCDGRCRSRTSARMAVVENIGRFPLVATAGRSDGLDAHDQRGVFGWH